MPDVATLRAVVSEVVDEALSRYWRGVEDGLSEERHLVAMNDLLEDVQSRIVARAGRSKRQKRRAACQVRELSIAVRKNLARLEALGFSKIRASGRVDYAVHEPGMQIPTSRRSDDGVIVDVLRNGYFKDGRVWRPALVTVLKYVAEPETDIKDKEIPNANRKTNAKTEQNA